MQKLKSLLVALYHLLLVFLLGTGSNRSPQKPPTIKQPRLRFSGTVRDYGYFIRCSNITLNFDLCGLRAGTNKRRKPHKCWHFDDGFMRAGDTLSAYREERLPLADLDNWELTQARDLPVADVVHREPVLFIDNYHDWNPAIIVRQIHALLHHLETLKLRPEDTTVLFFHSGQPGALFELMTRLFKVKNAGVMSGVHLFQNAIHVRAVTWSGWHSREVVELARRRLLSAFGITPRQRSESINRITLVSRQDYKVGWGLNQLERKISNEDEIIAVLRKRFPDAEVHAVQLEQLSVKEQLQLIHETDILIGMHGAALGFSTLLPENAGLLELFPAYFLSMHWYTVFYLLAIGGGMNYRRWINLNSRREYCSERHAQKLKLLGHSFHTVQRDFTEVPPQAVLRRVRALQRAMRKRRGNNQA